MGANSKIEWTTHTFNPWIGCERVSPGCDNCYAERGSKRLGAQHGLALWKGDHYITAASNWRQPLAWNRAAERSGERPRVFCASYADVFENQPHLASARARLWELIEETPYLRWLLLTKRPEHILELVPERWKHGNIPEWVWLGTTGENQEQASIRVPVLLAAKLALGAKVAFLSHEPGLGPVELGHLGLSGPERANLDALRGRVYAGHPELWWRSTSFVMQGLVPAMPRTGLDAALRGYFEMRTHLDWVITGGESGPRARPFDVRWARDLVAECRAAGVACFVKQLGSNVTWNGISFPGPFPGPLHTEDIGGGFRVHLHDRKGGDSSEWPADLQVREIPC